MKFSGTNPQYSDEGYYERSLVPDPQLVVLQDASGPDVAGGRKISMSEVPADVPGTVGGEAAIAGDGQGSAGSPLRTGDATVLTDRQADRPVYTK